jgi:periplasmic protein TonB
VNSRRARRLLFAAFAISILVHALVALVMHPPRAPIENQAEVVSIHHVVAVTRLVTPPPQPKRTPVPHPAATSPAPRATHATQSIGAAGGIGRATAAPTPQPTVAATATSAEGCTQPNAGAAVVATPSPPDIPVDVRAEGTSGVALIDVHLDAQGAVTDTKVSQSTGNPSLDLVAVGLARNAQYSPATRACKAVASTYTFSVKFVSW